MGAGGNQHEGLWTDRITSVENLSTFSVDIETGDSSGERWERVSALVDTGASYTWIPRPTLERLGVAPTFRLPFILADGRRIERDLAETRIRLRGQIRTRIVVFGDEGSQVLMGADTLQGFSLAPDPVNHRLMPIPGVLMSYLE